MTFDELKTWRDSAPGRVIEFMTRTGETRCRLSEETAEGICFGAAKGSSQSETFEKALQDLEDHRAFRLRTANTTRQL